MKLPKRSTCLHRIPIVLFLFLIILPIFGSTVSLHDDFGLNTEQSTSSTDLLKEENRLKYDPISNPVRDIKALSTRSQTNIPVPVNDTFIG